MALAMSLGRTAMFHRQLAMGAEMAPADGWLLPAHFGDVAQESLLLRNTVGVSDISPIGKLRIVGSDAAQAVRELMSQSAELLPGSVAEAELPIGYGGGRLLAACLAADEYLLLTPPNRVPAVIGAAPAALSCAHLVDATSALAGVSIIGPNAERLLARITALDVSARALPDLTCAQSRFAGVQALLLHRNTHGIQTRHLYTAREYGEYLWETLVEIARDEGGGPVGTEAMSTLGVDS